MPDLAADARLLAAAGDPGRLAILERLAAVSDAAACELGSCCERSQPTVSHHLRVLREAGWVRVRACGSRRYYSIDPDAIAAFHRIDGAFAALGDAGQDGSGTSACAASRASRRSKD